MCEIADTLISSSVAYVFATPPHSPRPPRISSGLTTPTFYSKRTDTPI